MSTCTPSIEPTREWSECTSALQVAVTDINSQVRPHCPSAYYVSGRAGLTEPVASSAVTDRRRPAKRVRSNGPEDPEGAICATCPTSAGNEHRLQQAVLFLSGGRGEEGGRQPAEVRDPSAPPSASVRCLLMESDKIGIVSGACWCGQHRPRDDEAGDELQSAMTRIIAMGHVEGPSLVNREKDVCITTLADSVNHITSTGHRPTGPDYARGRVLSAPTSILLALPGGQGPLPSSLLSWSTTSSSSSPPPFCPTVPDRREYTGRRAMHTPNYERL